LTCNITIKLFLPFKVIEQLNMDFRVSLDTRKLFSVLWRPERAMSYAIAIYANTSSNQAIKDPTERRYGYSNLGKILIKSVAAERVAATFVAARTCRKIPFPDLPPI
jgi:hypothetical protein